MNGKHLLWAGLLVLAACGLTWGQAPQPAPTEAEVLSPEQLQKFFEQARVRRLSMERAQVTAEIEGGQLMVLDEDRIKEAVKHLSTGAKNTWEDNAERTCRAFGMVHPRFGRALEKFRKGDCERAAQDFKAIISTSERDTSYFAAAKRFCYAEALAGLDRNEDAVEAYLDLVTAMPDRFSFAALSLLEAGRLYEKMHRRLNAMGLYQAWIESFGLLDPTTARKLAELTESIIADYKDPLGTLSTKMTDVEQRLLATDSGRTTQERQRDIIIMLDDLIATAEEQSGGGQGQSQQQGRRKNGGKSDCQGQASGAGSGRPAGLGVPSSPAKVSALVGGAVVRPTGLSKIRPSDPSDDWGRLPPRQREELLKRFQESMPERYREMIRDYYRALASDRGG